MPPTLQVILVISHSEGLTTIRQAYRCSDGRCEVVPDRWFVGGQGSSSITLESTALEDWWNRKDEFMPPVERLTVPEEAVIGEPVLISGNGWTEGDHVEVAHQPKSGGPVTPLGKAPLDHGSFTWSGPLPPDVTPGDYDLSIEIPGVMRSSHSITVLSPRAHGLLFEPTCGGQEGFCRKLAEEAITVVRGRVASPRPEEQRTEPTDAERGVVFRDWDVEVEEYILKPQPFDRIQVRTFHSLVFRRDPSNAVSPPSPPMKEPPLREGEEVLLFLNKREIYGTRLKDDQFTIVGPLSGADGLAFGKVEVEGNLARTWIFGPGLRPWERLDGLIAFLKGQPTLPTTRVSPERAAEKALAILSTPTAETPAVQEPRNAGVSLMSAAQYTRLAGSETGVDRNRLLWVVEVEGRARDVGTSPEEAGKGYSYAVVALDARTGQLVASARRTAPLSFEGMTAGLQRILVWPEMESGQPDQVQQGDRVSVAARGGFIFLSPRGYDESNRAFALFLDSQRLGTMECYVQQCYGAVTISADASNGTHRLSVEGGSSIYLQIGSNPIPRPTPTPTTGRDGQWGTFGMPLASR